MASAGGAAVPVRSVNKARREKRNKAGQVGASASQSKAAQLLIDAEYSNELPKPPIPKLLRALPTVSKLCRYTPTLLELDHRPLLVSEQDLLSCIEFVDPEAYGDAPAAGSMPPPPPPKDAQLLRDDDVSHEEKMAQIKRRRLTQSTEAFHREAFGLQLPQLVTNDVFTERQRFTTGTEASEKKLYREPPIETTVEEMVRKVEETFETAKATPVHPTKPSLKPKRVMPLVPDAVLWANRYRQVVFDELPSSTSRNDLLFKTVPTPRATCFGLFQEAEPGSYKLAQNYFWDNRGGYNRALGVNEGEALMLSLPPDDSESGEALFVAVPTWMRLKKQKAQRLDIDLETKALHVHEREPSSQEQEEERARMRCVLSDEFIPDTDEESALEYIDGEWQQRKEYARRTPSHTTPGASSASMPGGTSASQGEDSRSRERERQGGATNETVGVGTSPSLGADNQSRSRERER